MSKFKPGYYTIEDTGTASDTLIGPFYCKVATDLMKHACDHLGGNMVPPNDFSEQLQPIKVFRVEEMSVMMPAVSLKKGKLSSLKHSTK